MKGLGKSFLEFSFLKLKSQTYSDFEVVISDHSKDDSIKSLCESWNKHLNIKYIHNPNNIGSSASNINNALKNCNGDWIKILFQDDFLYNENSIEIVDSYISENKRCKWLVTACEHSNDGDSMIRTFYPKWNERILFNNTISSPSVLTIKNEEIIYFDENLIWYMDCEYYHRLYSVWGIPDIVNEICVVNRLHEHQVTNSIITQTIIENEDNYIKNKYGRF